MIPQKKRLKTNATSPAGARCTAAIAFQLKSTATICFFRFLFYFACFSIFYCILYFLFSLFLSFWQCLVYKYIAYLYLSRKRDGESERPDKKKRNLLGAKKSITSSGLRAYVLSTEDWNRDCQTSKHFFSGRHPYGIETFLQSIYRISLEETRKQRK